MSIVHSSQIESSALFLCCIALSFLKAVNDYLFGMLLAVVLIKVNPFLQSKKLRNLKAFSVFNSLVWECGKYFFKKTFRAAPKEIVGVSFVQRHLVDIKCLWWCSQLLSNHLWEKYRDLLSGGSASLLPPLPKKSSPWWNWFVSLFQSNGVIAQQLSVCWIVKTCFWGQCQPLWPLWTVTWVRIAGIRPLILWWLCLSIDFFITEDVGPFVSLLSM